MLAAREPLKLVISQEPIAKARHRHYYSGGRVITFDPQAKDVDRAKRDLLFQMRENGFNLAQDEALSMSLTTYSQIPRSWPKRRQNASEGQPCLARPDLDNYVKFYSDVLNGIAYDDDRQITRLWAEKLYSDKPRVEIVIQPIGGGMINEHAITVQGELTMEQLNYIIKKANKLGLQNRQIIRVYSQKDNEGEHIYFEAEGLKSNAHQDIG